MNALRYLLGWLLLAGAAPVAHACSCIDGGPFLTAAQRAAWQPNTLIARVQVVRQRAHGMEVRVLDVLHGSESRSTIMVWGDPGFLCRLYTSGFKPTDRLVLIVRRLQPSTYLYTHEQPGDYELGGCGTYGLREDMVVTGRIANDVQAQTYPEFRRTLAELLNVNAPHKPAVYPIPATSDVIVDLPEQAEQTVNVRVMDLSGRVLASHELSTGQSHQLPLTSLPSGLYILRFESEHTRFSRRVVKQ